jgi:hypothetical protein
MYEYLVCRINKNYRPIPLKTRVNYDVKVGREYNTPMMQ